MHSIKLSLAATATLLLAGPALAQDCAGRIDTFERVLDLAADEAISASSGGQAVAGAREAQAMETPEEGVEDPVPFQEEPAEVEEAEDAGDGGERVIQARTALQNARELAESGDDAGCAEAINDLILSLLED